MLIMSIALSLYKTAAMLVLFITCKYEKCKYEQTERLVVDGDFANFDQSDIEGHHT